jgi:SNF2 family DNA or RNA helicase
MADILECCICFDPLAIEDTKVIRTCTHFLCNACVDRLLTERTSKCPMCRKEFARGDVVEAAALQRVIAGGDEGEGEGEDEGAEDVVVQGKSTGRGRGKRAGDSEGAMVAAGGAGAGADSEAEADLALAPSPKIEALIEELTKTRATDPTAKAVVFSQFLGFIDIIQHRLTAEGFTTGSLTGKQTAPVRKRQLAAFSADDGPTVLLVSLKAGNCGINLTRASHVFLMDLWWNSAVEDQAADRVHRIGQTRPVFVEERWKSGWCRSSSARRRWARARWGG